VTDCRVSATDTRIQGKYMLELTLLAVVALHSAVIPRLGALLRVMAKLIAITAFEDLLVGTIVLSVARLIAVEALPGIASTTALRRIRTVGLVVT
jgi:hypothetical protein